MKKKYLSRSAIRALWLAELSKALDEAQMLLSRLVAEQMGQADAEDLRRRIEELCAELRALRRRGLTP